MKVNNALVTWDDLTTMGLTTKSTPPTGKGIVNKGELNTYYVIDNTVSPMSGYTNERCPRYQDILPGVTLFSNTVSYASSVCNACNAPTGTIGVGGNAATFCASTTFTSSSFAALASGNYVLVYGGNSLNVSTTLGSQTATVYGGGCQACSDTNPVWTATGYTTCVSCSNVAVFRDTNSCSASYGNYRVNGVDVGGTEPSRATCSTAANYSTLWGYTYSCSNGTVNSTAVYKNSNSCFSGDQYKIGTTTYATDPSETAPSTSANWVFQYYNCFGCTTRTVERDMNPCSPTYLGYTVDHGAHVGTTAPANTGACNTSATWVVAFGSYECVGCDQYFVEVDNNPCSSTSGQTRRGSLRYTNTTNCLGCCGQSTSPTWTIIFGSYECSGCDKYYMEYDSNNCSSTFGQQRRSTVLAQANSPYCCAGVLSGYTLSSSVIYYDGCNGFSNTSEVYTVTLRDQYGNPIAATSNIEFVFSYDYAGIYDVGNDSGTATQILTVYAGSSTGSTTFYTKTYEYCPYSGSCDGSCYSEQTNIFISSNTAGLAAY